MRHVYECQMRRADLHGDTISNVTFVDYLQEARLDLPASTTTRHPRRTPARAWSWCNTVVEYSARCGSGRTPALS